MSFRAMFILLSLTLQHEQELKQFKTKVSLTFLASKKYKCS